MRLLHHSHDGGPAVDVGPDLNGNGNYKVRLFSETDGPTFGDHEDVNSALEAFHRAFHFAIKEHARDGKLREVSVIIGHPRPVISQIICPRCKRSGAGIHAWSKSATPEQSPSFWATCNKCWAGPIPITKEQYDQHVAQLPKPH